MKTGRWASSLRVACLLLFTACLWGRPCGVAAPESPAPALRLQVRNVQAWVSRQSGLGLMVEVQVTNGTDKAVTLAPDSFSVEVGGRTHAPSRLQSPRQFVHVCPDPADPYLRARLLAETEIVPDGSVSGWLRFEGLEGVVPGGMMVFPRGPSLAERWQATPVGLTLRFADVELHADLHDAARRQMSIRARPARTEPRITMVEVDGRLTCLNTAMLQQHLERLGGEGKMALAVLLAGDRVVPDTDAMEWILGWVTSENRVRIAWVCPSLPVGSSYGRSLALYAQRATMLDRRGGVFRSEEDAVTDLMIRTPELAADVAGRLDAPDPAARAAAARALQRAPRPLSAATVRALIARLPRDEEPAVRAAIAGALGSVGDARTHKDLVPALVRACADEQESVRQAAFDALDRLGQPKPAAKAAMKEIGRPAPVPAALRIIGWAHNPRAVDRLLRLLYDPKYTPSAAWALGEIGERKALPALLLALEVTPTAPPEAAEAIGKLGDRSAVPALQAAYGRSQWPPTQEAILGALGRLGGDVAYEQCATVLRGEHGFPVRQAAARALGQMGDRRAVPLLVEKLRDRESPVGQAAAEALGRLGDPQAVPALQACLSGDALARESIEALVSIGGPEARAALEQAARTGPGSVRPKAFEALGRIR
ncbi:MAG: HEAT repeat domain-containing protein [Armatimonadetes bacterium]|nr:HEAT repeat domain-containing protein [Armatimonadota bacterium]